MTHVENVTLKHSPSAVHRSPTALNGLQAKASPPFANLIPRTVGELDIGGSCGMTEGWVTIDHRTVVNEGVFEKLSGRKAQPLLPGEENPHGRLRPQPEVVRA